MKIDIRESQVEVTELLRAHVERRLRHTLGRFGERIERVIVRFSHADADRTDSVKRCQIDVGLRPRNVRALDVDADVYAAVDHATARVSRSVARALESWRDGGGPA